MTDTEQTREFGLRHITVLSKFPKPATCRGYSVAIFAKQLKHPSFRILRAGEDFIRSLPEAEILFCGHSISATRPILHCYVAAGPCNIEEKGPTSFGRTINLKQSALKALCDAFNQTHLGTVLEYSFAIRPGLLQNDTLCRNLFDANRAVASNINSVTLGAVHRDVEVPRNREPAVVLRRVHPSVVCPIAWIERDSREQIFDVIQRIIELRSPVAV